jgi:hypothetical protein
VGLVHGLAGSGALTSLAMVNLPSTATRLVYIGLFGLGSVVGMALLSGLLGWPLFHMSRRPLAARFLAAATGLASILMGIFWLWRFL